MKASFLITLSFFTTIIVSAQNVGIGTNTPASSAALEINATNKGLLLPRVTDHTAIPSPVKGLAVFNTTNNKLWLYNGTAWEQSGGPGTADNIWNALNDSIVYTSRKFIGIGTDASFKPRVNLEVNGDFVVEGKQIFRTVPATPAQTYTMPNSGTFTRIPDTDSVFRIFDPGGTANYANNSQGNMYCARTGEDNPGIKIRFNSSDYGLADGDTLWISSTDFPSCRNNYIYRFDASTPFPPELANTDNLVHFIFRANGTANARGFDITVTRLYLPYQEKNSPLSAVSTTGSAFYLSNGSVAGGFNSNARGQRSIALGDDVNTFGLNSVGIGKNVLVRGVESIAMGTTTVSTGTAAVAIGHAAYAQGNYSTALGNEAGSYGETSVAIGTRSRSEGSGSFAAGLGAVARAQGGVALGLYNDNSDTPAPGFPDARDRVFQVGNGIGLTNRSTAITVLRNGNVGIGTVSPNAPLQLSNAIQTRKLLLYENSSTESDFFGFGINNGVLRYQVPVGSNHTFFNGTNAFFTIFGNGNATLAGTLTQNSDARLKSNIQQLENALEKMLQLNGYHYTWKDRSRDQQLQTGLLAQEVQQLFPELVHTDSDGVLSVNYAGLTPVIIESIKELNKKVEAQQKQIEQLMKQRQ